jgi:hypothetical protein
MAKKTKYKKRRKDNLVDNTGGTTRVKPIKNVGDDGRVQVQQIKYADGSSHFNRYEDGKMVDQNYMPKKMRKKKIKKIRTKRLPNKLKKVPVPSYTAPSVTLDAEDLKEVARRERAAEYKKNKGKRTRKRIVRKVKDVVKTTATKIKSKLTPKPRRRKVKNLVTGKTNRVR